MTTLFDVPPPAPDPSVARHPVGPLVDTATGPHGLATATFDPTRTYRYRLSRMWDPTKLRVNFVMLNPSTADATVVDPTVRRCLGFAHAWGAGALEVTNAFALRATDPTKLYRTSDPVGPDNDDAIVTAARDADLVIVAWGVHATHLNRQHHVRDLLTGTGKQPHVLRLTKDGHPGHPLYLPKDTLPIPWLPDQP